MLSHHGLDTKTMIQLSFKDNEKIIEKLNQGFKLPEILTEGQTTSFFKNIQILSRYISFPSAISCANDIEQQSQNVFKQFLKEISYPIFLFCFAYILILFFSNSILPSIQMYDDSSFSIYFISILKWVYSLIFWGTIFILIVGLLFKDKLDIWKIPLFRFMYSYQFSLLFTSLLEAGIPTQDCIQLLKSKLSNRYISQMATYIYEGLINGESMIDVINSCRMFDSFFKTVFMTGVHSSMLVKMFTMYQETTILSIHLWFHRMSLFVQIFTYICVGLLVLVFYQVMLMPLNMLNSF